MMQYIILFILISNASIDTNSACGYGSPLVFPTTMPPAAQMISDVLSEELAWRADIFNFLNNSTNPTNQTKLIIA